MIGLGSSRTLFLSVFFTLFLQTFLCFSSCFQQERFFFLQVTHEKIILPNFSLFSFSFFFFLKYFLRVFFLSLQLVRHHTVLTVLLRGLAFTFFFFGLKEVSSSRPGSQWERIVSNFNVNTEYTLHTLRTNKRVSMKGDQTRTNPSISFAHKLLPQLLLHKYFCVSRKNTHLILPEICRYLNPPQTPNFE